MKNKRIWMILLPLFLAILCVGLYWSGIGRQVNNRLCDWLFQQGDSPSGTIFLLEIDAHSLEELGPYQTWTRDYVAEAIERLNSDPEQAPDIIGVDILYIGNTTKEADSHLTEACRTGGNVVLGSFLNIDSTMVKDEAGYYMSDQVTLYEEPFLELNEVTAQGFVNGFADEDGVIRHGMQQVTLQDGRCIPSFSYAVYQKYAEQNGLPTELAIPDNEDGLWYLSYQAAAGGYSNSYSLSDFIQGEIPTDRFADAIVLIGPYAEGLLDSYLTAIDYTELMYGVEIHANMIEAMLKQDFKRETGGLLQTILIVLTAVLVCWVCSGEKLRYGICFAVAGCMGYPMAAFLLYQQGIVLELLYIPVISLVVPICTVGIHYIRVRVQKHKVEQTFKRYVAPEVVEEIMKTGMNELQLGGNAVDIACLFVDIRGFTTMSEELPPEEVVSILNRYLDLTSSCIFRHKGTLDKFIGDATMAIYNAPILQEDYVYQAVLTAWDMVQGAKKLGKELEAKYGRTVSFGVGVHCGKAVVGNIGTARRMEYTAIGDTVNTAARLEANAPAGTILVSKAVCDILQERIQVESIGNLPLKGKKEELEIFKVIGVK